MSRSSLPPSTRSEGRARRRHVAAAANQIRPFCLSYSQIGQQIRAVFTIRGRFGTFVPRNTAQGDNPETNNPPGEAGCVGTSAGKNRMSGNREIPGKSDRKQVGKQVVPATLRFCADFRPHRGGSEETQPMLVMANRSYLRPRREKVFQNFEPA
jgi:hypothetical protein